MKGYDRTEVWREAGRRHSKAIGSLRQYPTKASAWRAAQAFRHSLEEKTLASKIPTIGRLLDQYRTEKMPERASTRRGYEVFIRNYFAWGFPMQSEWMTATEAAQYLKVKPRTVLAWAKQGRIPAHALSGSSRITWRFLKSELDAMLSPPSAAGLGGSIEQQN